MRAPEQGDALADAVCVVVGQGKDLALETRRHTRLDRIRVHKRIVGHQKKFFGDLNGKTPHRLRPLREILKVDAQNAVDDKIGGNGNMRAFMRHGSVLLYGWIERRNNAIVARSLKLQYKASSHAWQQRIRKAGRARHA